MVAAACQWKISDTSFHCRSPTSNSLASPFHALYPLEFGKTLHSSRFNGRRPRLNSGMAVQPSEFTWTSLMRRRSSTSHQVRFVWRSWSHRMRCGLRLFTSVLPRHGSQLKKLHVGSPYIRPFTTKYSMAERVWWAWVIGGCSTAILTSNYLASLSVTTTRYLKILDEPEVDLDNPLSYRWKGPGILVIVSCFLFPLSKQDS